MTTKLSIEISVAELNLIVEAMQFTAERVLESAGDINPFYEGSETADNDDQIAAAKMVEEMAVVLQQATLLSEDFTVAVEQ